MFDALYGLDGPLDVGAANDPNYQRDATQLLAGRENFALGRWLALGVGSSSVVGFAAGQNPFGPQCKDSRRTIAVKWVQGAVKTLGPGVAYAVNDSGDAVGDDELVFGGIGKPTLWSHGRAYRLDSRRGAAFAISNSGTIVGRVGSAGFVSVLQNGRRRFMRLDEAIQDRHWHVHTAYGVDGAGNILAVASRDDAFQVVVLRPAK